MYDKTVSLGSRLHYPITITKLLKSPGDSVKRQEHIIEYKFTWRRNVGEDEWTDETTYAEFDSPAEGKLKQWRVKEGQTINADMPCMTVEEACGHEVQMQGLCSLCGADMTEVNWATEERDVDRANINMVHDQTNLMVSKNIARRAEHDTQKRLLRQRKLSLVVDLDQTIIHACVDNTVGEWQKDKTNPNYDSVKHIKSFQLLEDANGFTYYIKQRPGLLEFLNEMSLLYEMHVYTMGTRAYALSVAQIVDPDKKIFGNRVISRDENGSLTAKSLQRLFPVSTDMVVIIDDRSDVWPFNRANLIKVVPYDFYKGIGDINSSFLPKRTDITPAPKAEVTLENGSSATPLAPTVGDDGAEMKVQEEEQEKTLERQSADRPLQQMQEELEKEEEAEEDASGGSSLGHHKTLLNDDDEELIALQDHLTDLHAAFYDTYDRKRADRRETEPHQPPGQPRQRRPSIDDGVDLSMVPDIGEILEELKSDVLSGLVIVLSGLVPLGTAIEESEIGMQAQSFGAQVSDSITPRVTHLVVSSERPRTKKVQQAMKIPSIRIVNQNWLLDCLSQWRRLDEGPYLMELADAGQLLKAKHDENDTISDAGTENDLPSGGALGNSLGNFNWDEADEELEQMLGDEELTSEDDDEEDGNSQRTTNTAGSGPNEDEEMSEAESGVQQGTKRKVPPESDSTEDGLESALAKKQRLARSRGASALRSFTTGDDAVADDDKASSLPTPGGTGDEGVGAAGIDGVDTDDELARELEAELEAAGV